MFFDRYVDLCVGRGGSPSGVATKLGISRSAVTNWKSGAIPQEKQLHKIAEYFGVTKEFLLGQELPTPERPPLYTNEHGFLPSDTAEMQEATERRQAAINNLAQYKKPSIDAEGDERLKRIIRKLENADEKTREATLDYLDMESSILSFIDTFESLCDEMGVKPSQTAERADIDKSLPSKWRIRGLTPRADQLIKLADYFNVSVDYLLGRTDVREMATKKEPPTEAEDPIMDYIDQMTEETAKEWVEFAELLLLRQEQRAKDGHQVG